MRKRSRIPFAILLFAIVGGIAWVAWRPSEPIYQGKRLSVWLGGYDDGTASGMEAADLVVRQLGTNAIPTLLRKLKARDFPFARQVFLLSRKQHLFNFKYTWALIRRQEGYFGFRALGVNGRIAVPELLAMYERTSFPESRQAIAWSLGAIGPFAKEAVPALVRGLEERRPDVDVAAALALGEIHAQPELAVPALIKCLSGQDFRLQRAAAHALGCFGADAKVAVPALLELLNSSEPGLEISAGEALAHINPEASATFAVPILVKSLASPNIQIRELSANALGSFGAAARSAVPGLLKSLDDPIERVRSAAKDSLAKIDPEAAALSELKPVSFGE